MDTNKNADATAAVWIPLGLVFGVAFALVLDNWAFGLAIGLVMGSALSVGFWADARRKRSDSLK